MKTLLKHSTLVLLMILACASLSQAQSDQTTEKKDYLIVVSNSTDKAANEQTLAEVKKNFKDAGMYYDEASKQYYVYVERYYTKAGADYAVWWLKRHHTELDKVWSKAVEPGTK